MEIDTQYSLELLKKINNLNVEGQPIHEFFRCGQYSDWASQQFFLLSQIKEFSRTNDMKVYARSRKPRFFLLSRIIIGSGNVVVLFASFAGYLYGRIAKPQVALFCSDFLKPNSPINPRLSVVITYLTKRQIPFVEILHVTTMKNFFRNMFRRGRPAIYIESLNLISSVICFFCGVHSLRNNLLKKISFDSFDTIEESFVKEVVSETIWNVYRNRRTIIFLEHFLCVSEIKNFISIDDVRYVNEILLACAKRAVPSHIFQHSNFDYLAGLDTLPGEEYIFPSAFVVWNAYWFRRVKEISPIFSFYSSRVAIGGRPYVFTVPKQVTRSQATLDEDITVLIPYEVALQRKHVQPYIDALLKDTRVRILFVLRKDFESNLQVERYFGTSHFEHPRLSVIRPQDKEMAIKQADVVIGVYSGFLDEAIEMGLPVCVLDTEYVNMNRLDRDDLAILIKRKDNDLFEKLRSAKDTSDEILQERKDRVGHGTGSVEVYLENALRN